MLKLALVLCVYCGIGWSFRMSCGLLRSTRKFGIIDGDRGFDMKAIEKLLKTPKAASTRKPVVHAEFNLGQNSMVAGSSEEDRERLYTTYPKDDLGLPTLQDYNDYYSGTFKDILWHQNAENFRVFIPIADNVVRSDVNVEFEVISVQVKIRGEPAVHFPTIERIKPDESFWMLENDKHGQKYLHLDMAKRHHESNWYHLFGDGVEFARQAGVMQVMYRSNQGLARMAGAKPETIDEMLSNPELMGMIGGGSNSSSLGPTDSKNAEGYDTDDANRMVTVTNDDGTQTQMTAREAHALKNEKEEDTFAEMYKNQKEFKERIDKDDPELMEWMDELDRQRQQQREGGDDVGQEAENDQEVETKETEEMIGEEYSDGANGDYSSDENHPRELGLGGGQAENDTETPSQSTQSTRPQIVYSFQ